MANQTEPDIKDFNDRTLNCIDHKGTFIFTAKDQAFFAKMGFSEPKRCIACRRIRKQAEFGQNKQNRNGN